MKNLENYLRKGIGTGLVFGALAIGSNAYADEKKHEINPEVKTLVEFVKKYGYMNTDKDEIFCKDSEEKFDGYIKGFIDENKEGIFIRYIDHGDEPCSPSNKKLDSKDRLDIILNLKGSLEIMSDEGLDGFDNPINIRTSNKPILGKDITGEQFVEAMKVNIICFSDIEGRLKGNKQYEKICDNSNKLVLKGMEAQEYIPYQNDCYFDGKGSYCGESILKNNDSRKKWHNNYMDRVRLLNETMRKWK